MSIDRQVATEFVRGLTDFLITFVLAGLIAGVLWKPEAVVFAGAVAFADFVLTCAVRPVTQSS